MNNRPQLHFSIVMPSHNRREQLGRALQHLAAQNYPSDCFELVLVLDGCNDGSAQMVEARRKHLPFSVQLINQAQGGPAAARNTGVRAARYDYVLFLDDDVMATPNLMQQHARLHLAEPNLVVVGSMSKPSDHYGPIWIRWEEYILEQQYQDLLTGKYQFTPRQFYTGNCSLARHRLFEAGLFDESFKRYEDVELAYRLYHLGMKFVFNHQAQGYHYPTRTFASWTKAHYLYGQYAVRIERDKNQAGMIAMAQREFKTRHWMTRVLAEKMLNRTKGQKIAAQVLLQVANVAGKLRQERRSYQALSCIANMLFWQGFNEELQHSRAEQELTVYNAPVSPVHPLD